MRAAILFPCLMQAMFTLCESLDTVTSKVTLTISNPIVNNETSNVSSSNINKTNTIINTTNQTTINDSSVNNINATDGTLNQNNASISNVNSTDLLEAEGSISEEVVFPGTPVMGDCVNDSADFSNCMERMLNLTQECANETGATQDDVNIAMRMEIPSSDTGKCLTRCLLKHRGVMSPEGLFSPAATVEYLTEVHKNQSLELEFQKLADYCFGKLKLQPISSLDTCQFAYDIALCTEEYHKTLFLRNPAMAPPVNAITTP